ncbi:flagellar hook-associated protein 3, partial [candidate division GN15 bacterium]|nr:flagellar hook-associated protein 3 [candidate division GN15 bacterium]
MRVTNTMMVDRVVFNMQRSLRRYLDLQTEMSSGRRINNPSDDPLGTLRDLDYRTQLSRIDQYRKNISQAMNWVSSYDETMKTVSERLNEAKQIVVDMANETYDEAARRAAADVIDSVREDLVLLSNTQISGRYMFSGHSTRRAPLEFAQNGVIYRGDDGRISFDIDSNSREAINFTGAEAFLGTFAILGENADLNPGVTDDTLLSELNGANGIDLTTGTFTITDLNLGGVSTTVDLNAAPPAATVGEALTKINDALVAAGMDGAVSVSISEDGNRLFVDTTETGEVSVNTMLARLHQGNGINMTPGRIRVTDGAGIDVTIDVSAAQSLDDVITTVNNELAAAGVANVTMGINATNTGLQIQDTNGVPLGLRVEDVGPDDTTAQQLGIVGEVGALLTGSDLNPEASIEITETTGTTGEDLGLLGTYRHDRAGEDIDPALSLNTLISDLNDGRGLEGDSIVMHQGERTLTVDLSDPAIATVQDLIDYINTSGLDVTASMNLSGKGVQIENDDPNRSFLIEEVGEGRAARTMGLYGASDTMGAMIILGNALEKNDQEGISLLTETFDKAITEVLEVRADVGTRGLRLELTDSRLVDLDLSFTRLLSEVEDADITQVVTDLASHESSYQA